MFRRPSPIKAAQAMTSPNFLQEPAKQRLLSRFILGLVADANAVPCGLARRSRGAGQGGPLLSSLRASFAPGYHLGEADMAEATAAMQGRPQDSQNIDALSITLEAGLLGLLLFAQAARRAKDHSCAAVAFQVQTNRMLELESCSPMPFLRFTALFLPRFLDALAGHRLVDLVAAALGDVALQVPAMCEHVFQRM